MKGMWRDSARSATCGYAQIRQLAGALQYYAEFTRQVEASYPDRIQRIFLKMNSVSDAKRVYPVVRRLGFRTKQSSPMLHARLVMVETTRDQAVALIEKLREQGMQVALQDDFHLNAKATGAKAFELASTCLSKE